MQQKCVSCPPALKQAVVLTTLSHLDQLTYFRKFSQKNSHRDISEIFAPRTIFSAKCIGLNFTEAQINLKIDFETQQNHIVVGGWQDISRDSQCELLLSSTSSCRDRAQALENTQRYVPKPGQTCRVTEEGTNTCTLVHDQKCTETHAHRCTNNSPIQKGRRRSGSTTEEF